MIQIISYKPLFHVLLDRDIKKEELRKLTGISSSTMAKMSKNEIVSLKVIDSICKALNIQPGDMLEYIPDKENV